MADERGSKSPKLAPPTPGLALLQDFFNTFDSIRNQLKLGNDRATIPLTSITALGVEGVVILRRHLQTSTAVEHDFVVDAAANCVVVIPTRTKTQIPAVSPSSELTTCEDDDENDVDDSAVSQTRAFAKVRRPANAFILYRKDWHARLATQYPKLHNNEICELKWQRAVVIEPKADFTAAKIVGRKWRDEHAEVKLWYKQKAEEVREQHAIDNPGYSYQPRKPSEKKRRASRKRRESLPARTYTVDNLTEVLQQELPYISSPIKLLDEGLARIAASDPMPEVHHGVSYGIPRPTLHQGPALAPGHNLLLFGSGDDDGSSISAQVAAYNARNQRLPFAAEVVSRNPYHQPPMAMTRPVITAEPSVSGYLEQNTYYKLPDSCAIPDTLLNAQFETLRQLQPFRKPESDMPTPVLIGVEGVEEADRTLELESEDIGAIFDLEGATIADSPVVGRDDLAEVLPGLGIGVTNDVVSGFVHPAPFKGP